MINVRPPKREPGFTDTREFERWMYNIYKKLGDSGTTFDDLDIRSMSPILGMLQELNRKVESLSRDARNIKTDILNIRQKPAVTRSIMGKLAELERRIDHIEGEL